MSYKFIWVWASAGKVEGRLGSPKGSGLVGAKLGLLGRQLCRALMGVFQETGPGGRQMLGGPPPLERRSTSHREENTWGGPGPALSLSLTRTGGVRGGSPDWKQKLRQSSCSSPALAPGPSMAGHSPILHRAHIHGATSSCTLGP